MLEDSTSIQTVEDPILCSPWEEPEEHWLYDTETGRPSKVPARREASCWFRTERTGSAQRSLLVLRPAYGRPVIATWAETGNALGI